MSDLLIRALAIFVFCRSSAAIKHLINENTKLYSCINVYVNDDCHDDYVQY